MALPGNGTLLATSAERKRLFRRAAQRIVEMVLELEKLGPGHGSSRATSSRRGVRQRDDPRHGHGRLHQHGAPHAGHRARGRHPLRHRAHRRTQPAHAQPLQGGARSHYHVEDVHRAGGIHTILGSVKRGRPGLLNLDCPTVTGKTLGENIADCDIRAGRRKPGGAGAGRRRRAAGKRTGQGDERGPAGRVDPRADQGEPGLRPLRLHPRGGQRLQPGGRAGDPLRQPRPEGGGGQGRRRAARDAPPHRPGGDLRVRADAYDGHRRRQGQGGRRGGDPLRRAARRAGHAGDARPHVSASRAWAWTTRWP